MKRLPQVRFVFTGAGAQLETVKREAPANAEFRDYVPRELLGASLSSVDAHLVSLKPSLEGLIVPSKFYGILAVARPVLFVGARDGELARLVDAYHCGIVIEEGDVEGLVRAIESLARDRQTAAAMGARGRELYLQRFAPRHAFAAWERVLEEASTR
jgi:colanic acid biosynthesis glycosyl transferase WcaI